MLHEGNALWLETFALFAHPDAYRSIPSHRSTWGICVEEGEEVLVVLFGFLSFFLNFLLGVGRWRTYQPLETLLLNRISQTPAATQIQKPWEIQGWVDLRSSLLPN